MTSSAASAVASEVLARAAAKGVDLGPWFSANSARFEFFSTAMQSVLRKLPLHSLADKERAIQAHAAIKDAVAARRPEAEVAWFERNRPLLLAIAATLSKQQRAEDAAVLANATPVVSGGDSFELRTPAERTEANVAAIELLAGKEDIEDGDRELLRRYTGWGGLSIRKIAHRLPEGWVPDQRALIHEYYTPERIANAIATALLPFREDLAGNGGGNILALEPSAGIGRMVHAFGPSDWPLLRWTAIELSPVSAKLLAAIRPDLRVHNAPFEQWVADHAELQGSFDLVVSNPPYGARGKFAALDRSKGYNETKAYAYQIRRSLDFLRPGGIGVFLIPSGFVSGRSGALVGLRERVLQRAHLMAAYRLPSQNERGEPLFPGALLVTDLVFLRSRGGTVKRLPAEDEPIVQGRYFELHPTHILGKELGREGDDDDSSRRPRFGYQVEGTFSELPTIVERDQCRSCDLIPATRPESKPKTPLPEEAAHALALSVRVASYLALLSRNDSPALSQAAAAQAELLVDLRSWLEQPKEARDAALAHRKREPRLATLANILASPELLAKIEAKPQFEEQYIGDGNDVPGVASWLWRKSRTLTTDQLAQKLRDLGNEITAPELLTQLRNAGWCEDPEGPSPLLPGEQYYQGNLWPKYDRAVARAKAGDGVAATQAARLLERIGPANYAEITVEPRLGWLPVGVVEGWINNLTRSRGTIALERNGPFITRAGVDYLDIANDDDELRIALGYLNHDMAFFRPRTSRDEDLEDKRTKLAAAYRDHFVTWLEAEPAYQAQVVEAHNRLFRGWITPTYDQGPIEIARWNPQYPLWPYQNSAVRRLVSNRGGGCFFDVGLGKTRTLLGAVALAKQEGLARRVLIAAPNSLVFNWAREIERVLPDYRYAIIGARAKVAQRGTKRGEVVSEPDTPAQRASKWQRFQAGLLDLVIVTYSALPRVQMSVDEVVKIVRSVPAVQRELVLKVREAERRIEALEKRAKKGKLTDDQEAELDGLRKQLKGLVGTERKEAILAEREEGYAAKYAVPPSGLEADPGVYWEQLGVDFLAYDESHIGKNLWTAGAREGGEPRFLGAPQEGSYIAWQLYLRAYLVRQSSGNAGVYLADATPAKNSPLEFLSALSMLDSDIWAKLGITDTEQYITQYLNIQQRLIQDSDLQPIEAPCVVGFKNLDQLREVLFRFGEFRTAKEVGLKIPEPRVKRIDVPMDEAQEAKYKSYLELYQAALSNMAIDPQSKFAALGLLQRMALVAVHSLLDEGPPGSGSAEEEVAVADAPAEEDSDEVPRPRKKLNRAADRLRWTFRNAHLASNYHSPKLDKIADIIAERKDCGHIVFLENVAAHYWLKQILIERGLQADRIAVLNGETAQDPATRQRIAEGFTNIEAPVYDVVIANRIAYEGVNLQTRTCSIIHGDLPYEPATLQQRNGRGQRQGNRYDVIDIYYVLSQRSADMARFQLIAGKREWMSAILESAASETNNPAAQADMSPEEWLMYMSRDPRRTQELIEAKQQQAQAAESQRLVKLYWGKVRQIALRQRDVRLNPDPIQRAHMAAEIERIVSELNQADPLLWPWRAIVPGLGRYPAMTFGTEPGAVWESAVLVKRRGDDTQYGGGEFGRVGYSPNTIGYREYRKLEWSKLSAVEAEPLWRHSLPREWQDAPLDLEQELRPAIEALLSRIEVQGAYRYREMHMELANERYRADLWRLCGIELARKLVLSDRQFAKVPARGLRLATAEDTDAVYPWTADGLREFLKDCRSAQTLKWGEIDEYTSFWWGRRAPRDALTVGEEGEDHGEDDGQV
ncbi:MAG: hypothetical protein JNJ46_35020 [Myxococcales bacterium]|nr:hypothetical protein [Myxococcales bacterium]